LAVNTHRVRELATGLLDCAGIHPDIARLERFEISGLTNLMNVIELRDGSRYVLRVYQNPRGDEDLKRSRKEIFLHRLLGERGVPVAHILANWDDDDLSAILMEYLSGEQLGEATLRLSRKERDEAWFSCGAALRQIHEIAYPKGTYGVIVGDEICPDTAGSWSQSQAANILHHARRLSERQNNFVVRVDVLESILEQAIPALDRAPAVLLHNDPHPWNVLVNQTSGGWRCTGWIDWEYAWVGDPSWDLVRMDLFRFRPIGPTPSAFLEGYGSGPLEPNRSLYELSINLWMANQYLDGGRELMPTYETAMSYLDNYEIAIGRIQELTTSDDSNSA